MSAKMIGGCSSVLLSEAELRRLRSGSYEARIDDAARAIRSSFGGTPFQIVATRDGEAVVYSEGRFRRLRITDHVEEDVDLDVEVFGRHSTLEFAQREAGVVADLFVRGAGDLAFRHLRELALSARLCPPDVPGPVEHLETLLLSRRFWKRIFEARKDQILGFLGEDVGGAGPQVSGRLRPGVQSRLRRAATLRERVQAAVAAFEGFSDDDPVFLVFKRFSTDLAEDLQLLCDCIRRVAEVSSAHDCGKLFDTLDEGLRDREVSSRFVSVTAGRLAEARGGR